MRLMVIFLCKYLLLIFDNVADGDFATKKCVRSLREKIYRQSYEFMKQQRISCLLKGTWFPLFTNTAKRNGIRRNNHTIGITCSYRFYKLNPNLKVLHYGDFTDIGKSRPLLEELNERGMVFFLY